MTDDLDTRDPEEFRWPSRRIRRRVWVPGLGLLVILCLVLVTPFFLVRLDPVREWLLKRSLESAFADNVQIQVGRVDRFHPGEIRLYDVRFEETFPESVRVFARVDQIAARWNAWDLASGKISVRDLLVSEPWLDVSLLPDRIWAKKRPKSAPLVPRPLAPKLPPLSCDDLAIEGVAVDRSGEPWLRGDFAFGDLEHEDGRVHMRFEEGRVRSIPDSLDLTLSRGVVTGTWIEYLEVDSLRIESDAIDAGLAATFIAAPAGSTAVSLDGELQVGRVEPQRLAPLRNTGLPWRPDDMVQGTILFGGELAPREEPQADLVLGLHGRVFGTPVDTLHILADATPSVAELIDFRIRSGRQTLEGEGLWQPKAKRAEGRVSFADLDLAARPVAAFARKLPESRLDGMISGTVDSIGPNLRFDTSVRLDDGVLAGRPLGQIHANVVGDPERVLLDTLWVGSPELPQLRAAGWLERGGNQPVGFQGELTGLPMESWVEPWVGENLGGKVYGQVSVRGTLDRPEVSADLEVSAGTVVEITVDSLHVGPVNGTLRPFSLEAPFDARGLDFYGFTIDSLRADGVFGLDTLRTWAHGLRDTTDIYLAARVVPRDPGFAFIDELVAEPGSAPSVRLARPAVLAFSKYRVEMDSVLVVSEAGTATGSAWILPRPGASGTEPFAFEIEGEGLDLAEFADYYGLDGDSLAGTGSVRFSGTGTVEAPGYDVDFLATGGEIYGWLFRDLRLHAMAGAVGTPEGGVPHLFASTPGDTLSTPVVPPGVDTRGMFFVDSLNATFTGYSGRIPQVGPEREGPQPPGPPLEVRAKDVRLRSPLTWFDWVEAMSNGEFFPRLEEADLGGTVSVRNLPVAPWIAPILVPQAKQGTQATLATEAIDPMLSKIRIIRPEDLEEGYRSSGFGGRFDFDLELAGTGGDPEVRLDGLGRKIQVFQAQADTVAVSAVYVDSLLYLRDARWRRGDQSLDASGRVPLSLSVDPHHVGWTGRPLWIEAEVPSVDLALASLATALVEDPRGDLSGRVRLKGVPPNVYVEGNLSVKDGAFRIPLREERLSDVRAELRLDSLGVHIETAKGRWNESGEAEVTGWYRNPEKFELDGEARNATVFESGNYHFLADGTFHAEPELQDGVLRPTLSGDVLVHEGSLTLDLAKPGRQKVLVTPWIIDLDVEVPSNVRVIQPTSSIDLTAGELAVRYDMPYWSLGGKLDIASGQYLVFNKSLEIVEGRIDFLDTGTGPYPVLDVTAQTDIADPEGESTILVKIDVDGSPLPGEALTIVVSSPTHPDYTQEDLIDLLTIGQLKSSEFATGSSADPARGFLTGQVLNQLERELIREAPWLDVVDVRGGTDPNDPIVISFRAITEPQWSVRYSQELSAHPGREVSLSYRISNLFFLNASADQKEDDLGSSAETYSLDFRVRYEF
ncbi:MAG: translocation/assembly module TamB domain-containing protein [Candidatus Eisenbacteria bacterium]|uniref:Translocation/assembly module TamB domain-containing protein n=1 Tax=Eiseniibacteriota bacterium TaxID=2212470 RepID=A0A956SDF7_UNCEI|nr:translocation/assembly module TamB domain-containing protein [Candidatus Eisenbacteria bacterium]